MFGVCSQSTSMFSGASDRYGSQTATWNHPNFLPKIGFGRRILIWTCKLVRFKWIELKHNWMEQTSNQWKEIALGKVVLNHVDNALQINWLWPQKDQRHMSQIKEKRMEKREREWERQSGNVELIAKSDHNHFRKAHLRYRSTRNSTSLLAQRSNCLKQKFDWMVRQGDMNQVLELFALANDEIRKISNETEQKKNEMQIIYVAYNFFFNLTLRSPCCTVPQQKIRLTQHQIEMILKRILFGMRFFPQFSVKSKVSMKSKCFSIEIVCNAYIFDVSLWYTRCMHFCALSFNWT